MPLPSVPPICTEKGRLSGLDAAGTLGGTALEAVGELAVDGLEVLHAAGTSGLSPLGLLAPVDCQRLSIPRPYQIHWSSAKHTLAGLSSGVSA